MESKKQKCCNLCAILLTEENLAKRTQRCKPCHKEVESIRHKKYREDNIEKCHLQGKEYREKHKEYYKEYNKEKYQCHCGSIIANGSSSQHNKCPRHVAWANDVAKNAEKTSMVLLHPDVSSIQAIDNIISVLIRINNEARKPNINASEYGRCGMGIKQLLNKIENDFGIEFMIKIFLMVNKELKHTLGPLDGSIIKKLLPYGIEIVSINKVVEYNKN